MFFFEHLICYIKQGADIVAGCMAFRGLAPDVCMKKIPNFGHCRVMAYITGRLLLSAPLN